MLAATDTLLAGLGLMMNCLCKGKKAGLMSKQYNLERRQSGAVMPYSRPKPRKLQTIHTHMTGG